MHRHALLLSFALALSPSAQAAPVRAGAAIEAKTPEISAAPAAVSIETPLFPEQRFYEIADRSSADSGGSSRYDPRRFDLRREKAKLTQALPGSRDYKFTTISGPENVIALLQSKRSPAEGDEASYMAEQLEEMQKFDQLRAVFARIQTRKRRGTPLFLQHAIRIYANDGSMLELNYSGAN